MERSSSKYLVRSRSWVCPSPARPVPTRPTRSWSDPSGERFRDRTRGDRDPIVQTRRPQFRLATPGPWTLLCLPVTTHPEGSLSCTSPSTRTSGANPSRRPEVRWFRRSCHQDRPPTLPPCKVGVGWRGGSYGPLHVLLGTPPPLPSSPVETFLRQFSSLVLPRRPVREGYCYSLDVGVRYAGGHGSRRSDDAETPTTVDSQVAPVRHRVLRT